MAGVVLVAQWKFDDGSGSTAVDSSGNGFNVALNGTYSWGTGKLGGALSTTACYGLVAIGTAMNFGTGLWEFACWINTTTTANEVMCFRQDNTSPHSPIIYLQIGMTTPGTITFQYYDSVNMVMATTTAMANDGAWHYIDAWFDGTKLNVSIDNGTPVSTTSSVMNLSWPTPSTPFIVGCVRQDWISNNANYFTGLLDTMQIFSGNMTTSQRAINYATGSPFTVIHTPGGRGVYQRMRQARARRFRATTTRR